MDNYEKIKNLSVEEMVEFINSNNLSCAYCIYANEGRRLSIICSANCQDGIKKWLESEAE